jgi:hypothetical protein
MTPLHVFINSYLMKVFIISYLMNVFINSVQVNYIVFFWKSTGKKICMPLIIIIIRKAHVLIYIIK